jgi:hypothetical protein
MVKKLDRRTLAVEQILPTLATKVDLHAFATKEDLKAFATKEDLKVFATKEDLKAYATKADLDEVKRFVLVLHEDLKSDIGLIAEHLADVMTRLPPRAAP